MLKEIKFEGNKTIDSGDLLSKIATSPTSGFFSKTPRYYDADLFELDLKRIVRWYNEKGFYDARIANLEEQRDDKGRVTLVVKIDEGKRAYIRKMDLEGLQDIPAGEVSDINAALPIHAGDPFDEDGYEKAKDVLLAQLKEHGFPKAEVSGRVEVSPEDASAHVILDADPGERFHFGKVVVTGNHRIPADQIITATGIDKGQTYSTRALALAQQRVYNLGAFSGVRVSLEPLGDTPVAAVRVNVREAPFHTVRVGIGGEAEETRWELPRLRGEYTNRSLLGGLRRLELESQVGYAFVERPWDYNPGQSGITTRSSAQLTVPNTFIPSLDFVTRGEFAREVQSGFSYDEVAARLSLLYRSGPHSIAPSLNFVRYFLVDLPPLGLIGQSVAGAGIVDQCRPSCTLTYPELRYTYDGRDNAIEPTQGFYATLSLQQTLKPGKFSYFRLNPDVRAYAPFTRYMVIAVRAQYGAMDTEGGSGTPFTQRFFFGGQNEQRGYAPLRQGPKVGAQPTCLVVPDAKSTTPACKPGETPYATVAVPRGGQYALLFSGELRLHADWLLNHLGVVAFVDASRVQDQRNVLDGGLEVAPGLGLRYLTAFGPIRFDIAYVLNPLDVKTDPVTVTVPGSSPPRSETAIGETRVSSFCPGNTPGCIHESRWAFHVTLGEAF